MRAYRVLSGPLNITIVAETAQKAALDALRWWDETQPQTVTTVPSENAHRANLDPAIVVSSSRRPGKLFPTFSLLARARGESPAAAWKKLLHGQIAHLN